MNDTTTRESGAQMLARIKPRLAEGSTLICLRPDLLDGWEEAHAALAEAEDALTQAQQENTSTARLGQKGTDEIRALTAERRELAEKVADFEKQIDESQVRFTFRAMPKDEWSELCDQYPPRDSNMIDQMAGYDRTAVAESAVRETLVDPVFEDCEKEGCAHADCGSWQQLVTVLNPTEWDELKSTCNRVNGMFTPPKSQLASRILGQHSNDSAPLEPGE